MAMMSPTARMLMCLTPFERAGEVMDFAAADPEAQQVRVVRLGDEYRILLPGEDGSPVLLELELCEPSFFLTSSPGSATRAAEAIAAAVRR
jgi:hypothetical protein